MATTPAIIVISGPTASGKSKLAAGLAKKYKSAVINADARQVYKELKIGVAQPEPKTLNLVPHYLYQFLSVEQKFNAALYAKKAASTINTLQDKMPVLFVCGGSGLYIDALLFGLNHLPEISNQVRNKWRAKLDTHGLEYLQNSLKKIDFETYKTIDLFNPRRILRALEVSDAAGKPYSTIKTNNKKPKYNFIQIATDLPRTELYARINNRVEKMMTQGFLQEAEQLIAFRNLSALQTLGYQELFNYLDGKISIQEAVSLIKQNTRRYAKRQMTWLRRKSNILWHAPDNADDIVRKIDEFLRGVN